MKHAAILLTTAAIGALIALSIPEPSPAEECHGTAHLRMPLDQSARIKRQMLAGRNPRDYELDHIIPLCLGGSNDRANLQLQLWSEAHKKDKLEWYACRAVCENKLDINVAKIWFTDWKYAYHQVFGVVP